MEILEYGKTTVISILSKLIKNKKVLIIDFDLINNNMHSVFGVHKLPKEIKEKLKDQDFISEFKLKEENIRKLIVKIDRKSYLISSTNIIFDERYICNKERVKEMLENLKKTYDLILIDSNSDTKYKDITKTLINLSDRVICLIEGNLIYIRKTMQLLNDNIQNKEKIKLIYNKKSKYTISTKILKIIFLKFKMIGILKYNIKYNQILNKNVNKLYISKNIRKEFEKIIKRL